MAGLPHIGPDQTFQLWLIETDDVRYSAGLFQASRPGEPAYIPLALSQPIGSYQAVGMSIEPAGGSPFVTRPSGPRVFAVPIMQ